MNTTRAEAEMHEQIDEFSHRFDARINLDDLCDLLKIELDFESYDFENTWRPYISSNRRNSRRRGPRGI